MNGHFSRIQRLLPVLAGLMLIGAAFIVDTVFDGLGTAKVLGATFVVSGCALIGLGVVAPGERVRAALARGSLALLSGVLLLGLAEVTFRIVGFNFNTPHPAIPIFNRPPTVPAGDGILRRPGPASWRGRPLCSFIEYCFGTPNAYPDEPLIEVHYDKLGFRNPATLTNWEVVVTGDSFVESGYLPYEEIFTTIAAQQLGIRIKNLGVSGTGPVFQTAYVMKYGKATATKLAVLCFFDGNDVTDLLHEVRDTNFIHRTGYRRGHQKQTSLLVALRDRLQRLPPTSTRHETGRLTTNALFVAGNRKYPAVLWPGVPPRWEDLKKDRQELVTAALARWGQTVRSQGMRPWVMCIPDHRRVIQGYLRYADTNSPMARWPLSPFGPHLAKICADLNVGFIDTFPALRREVEAGQLPYHLLGDFHLTGLGSRVVAQVLADALRAELPTAQ